MESAWGLGDNGTTYRPAQYSNCASSSRYQRSTPGWGKGKGAKRDTALWQFQTGGAIRSGPMSYFANDKQYVAVAGGHALFVFALD
jgi:hypothetical protein